MTGLVRDVGWFVMGTSFALGQWWGLALAFLVVVGAMTVEELRHG